MISKKGIQVAIVGAGPAGLYAAEKLRHEGYNVAIFNRDVKPGGMAEYGIFPDKYALKCGLRKQFNQILSLETVTYYGNVTVENNGCVSLEHLREWGFPAVVVTSGAQGTKWLNLPGEKSKGVYHAKDVVYHYNSLPPFSMMQLDFGKKVAVIGAGKVMADIVHYLVKYRDVEEIYIIVRRGPAEVKFEKKELEPIINSFDLQDLNMEFEHVAPVMRSIGQDPLLEKTQFLEALEKAYPRHGHAEVKMRFLLSPIEIIADDENNTTGIIVENNLLVVEDGKVISRGTGVKETLELDSVVFAIGDRVDENLGLPMRNNEYTRSLTPRFPVEGLSYEIMDPDSGKWMEGLFVAGWARQASSGLVGLAKKDGVYAAAAVNCYLKQKDYPGVDRTYLDKLLHGLPCKVVRKDDLPLLDAAEKENARQLGVEDFNYLTNDEMLKVMGL